MHNGRKRRHGGFTFVELMVVVTIMVILIAIAIPQLSRSIIRSKESVLRNNLTTLRHVLDDYCYDKGKCPASLSDLVTDGYLRALPGDPMNNYSTEWATTMEDATQSVNPSDPGIWEVHSRSDKTSLEGTPYADW